MTAANSDDQMSRGAAALEKISDFGEGKVGQLKRWKAELDAGKRSEQNWHKKGEKTLKRYRDERDAVDAQDRKFNILWANVQTLKPAVYSKPPSPEVSRRFDTSSQVNRVAASIMERNLHFTVCEHSMFDATMNQCVEDRLLPGRGTAWVRYVADLKPVYHTRPTALPPIPPPQPEQPQPPMPGTPEGAPPPPQGGVPGAAPMGGPPAPPQLPQPPQGPPGMPPPTQPPIEQLPPGPLPMLGAPQPTPLPQTPPQSPDAQNKAVTGDAYESQVISGEQICFDYVYWKDFRMSPCRTWDECCWVARRVYMTRENGNKRFGEAVFKDVPLNHTEKITEEDKLGNKPFGPGSGVLKKAAIWEIWSKDDLKVYWLCEDHTEILDVRDDLFQLDDFFPCPKPLLATTTNESTIPIPDYCMYQDQAQELDQITNRISLLTQALKVIGLYDKTQDGVQRLLTEGVDNVMIPVDNWAMFAERGGLKGTVDFFPVELVSKVLTQLITDRGTVKQDIYEITGIADIVRGASVASETATAQTIKEKFANIRINDVQKDIARFASDLVNMAAQLMTNFFQPETLIINADLADPEGPDFQYVPQAVQLIKDGKLIQHKITVSVDAITEQDDKDEQTARNDFMQNFGFLMQQMVPAVEKMPQIAPMIGHIMLWSVRGFKIGRDIEGEIEQGIAQMAKQGPPEPPPDPAAQKLQAEAQAHQQAMQQEQEKHQADAAREQELLGIKKQGNEEDLRYTNAKHEEELNFMRQKNALALEAIALTTTAKVDAAAQQTQQDLAATGTAHVQKLAHTDEMQAQKLAHGAAEGLQGLAQADQTHAQGLDQGAEAHAQGQAQEADAAAQALAQAEAAAKAKKEPGNA
jgi:hypothetical protein